jgi:hypothetical protein
MNTFPTVEEIAATMYTSSAPPQLFSKETDDETPGEEEHIEAQAQHWLDRKAIERDYQVDYRELL